MITLSVEKFLRHPHCYMDTRENFNKKNNLQNLSEYKVMKYFFYLKRDPSLIPIMLKKKIRKNKEKIEKISSNDEKFTNLKRINVNNKIKFIETNLNKITNIHVN